MRKLFVLNLIVFLSGGNLYAQDSLRYTPPQNGPMIAFQSLEYDFGTVAQRKISYCVFEFTNVGNEPLIISDISSNCGCTVPQWNKAPILPGEKDKIRVRYVSGKKGNFLKTITVDSNSKEHSSAVLIIKGIVVDAKH